MERIELTYEYGMRRTRRWERGPGGTAFVVQVIVGQLADGRWFAQRSGYQIAALGGEAAYVFDHPHHGEQLAVRLAYSWMTAMGGRWDPIPAQYSPDGTHPADGLAWRRSGGGWVLGSAPDSG